MLFNPTLLARQKKVVTADQGNELDHLKGALSPENPLIELKSIS